MYLIRVVFAFILLALLAALLIPVMLMRPMHRNNMGLVCGVIGYTMQKFWGTHIEYENEERLKPKQATVLIANHQDTEDMFFAENIIRRGTVSLGKWELLYIPFIGLLFYLSGNIVIKRAKREKAQLALSIAAKKMIQNNLSVLIFPEGTRNWGKPLPFKLGAFKLAIEAQAPIQPVCFSLRQHTMDYSKYNPGIMKVRCLEPISTVGLTLEDAPALAARCQQLIEDNCIEITKTLPNLKASI